ncbi:integral membrane protein S linking to the trans Golgi network-domain-containing protein [Myxozyma melibiosi]|uniref:Integral membrane protein S linking to the trans Golgi network-domain-containing protein n=1 Tax=Myxozyma melibiosi TaxID=54550 RepID=A0ABR1FER4_9ASCO
MAGFRDRVRLRRRRATRPVGRYDSYAPRRLATQIVILQVLYYITAGGLLLFTCLVSGKKFSLDLVFGWRSIRIDTAIGWTLCLVWYLNSVFNVLFLTLFVGRSKLVFDFVLTLHGLNILITSLYSHHFPASLLWWMLQIASCLTMLSLGTWTSRWRELSVMYFPASSGTTSSTSQPGASDLSGPRGSGTHSEEYELVERQPDLEAGGSGGSASQSRPQSAS